jgi:hypothetical protein
LAFLPATRCLEDKQPAAIGLCRFLFGSRSEHPYTPSAETGPKLLFAATGQKMKFLRQPFFATQYLPSVAAILTI